MHRKRTTVYFVWLTWIHPFDGPCHNFAVRFTLCMFINCLCVVLLFPLQLLNRHLQSALIADAYIRWALPWCSTLIAFSLSFFSFSFTFMRKKMPTEVTLSSHSQRPSLLFALSERTTISLSLKLCTHIALHLPECIIRHSIHSMLRSLCSVNEFVRNQMANGNPKDINDVDRKINLISVILFDFIALKFTFGANCHCRPNDISWWLTKATFNSFRHNKQTGKNIWFDSTYVDFLLSQGQSKSYSIFVRSCSTQIDEYG